MHQILSDKIWTLIQADCQAQGQALLWKKPIVRFADANDPYFPGLKELIRPDHHLPQDFLPEAKTVISWFLPFLPEIGKSNLEGELCSDTWIHAYVTTNAMAARVSIQLAQWIQTEFGCGAAVPRDISMLGPEIPWSLWSQRHIAWLAGQGTFGMNNMLISDSGCVGRYYSLVTALEIPADKPAAEERCLYKRNGSCGLCMERCPALALSPEGFDRYKCMAQGGKNKRNPPGSKICGKCVVELPCSYKDPIAGIKE